MACKKHKGIFFMDKHSNIINDNNMIERGHSEITGVDGHEATYDHNHDNDPRSYDEIGN